MRKDPRCIGWFGFRSHRRYPQGSASAPPGDRGESSHNVESEDRLLVAQEGEQADRGPVIAWLNPLAPRWAIGIRPDVDPHEAGYREVLDACLEYADLVQDQYFPGGFLNSLGTSESAANALDQTASGTRSGRQGGELTGVVRGRPGGGLGKHWVTYGEEALIELPSHEIWPEHIGLDKARGHGGADYGLLERFFAAVRTGVPSPISLHEGLRMELPGIYAAESAAQGGELVEMRYPWS